MQGVVLTDFDQWVIWRNIDHNLKYRQIRKFASCTQDESKHCKARIAAIHEKNSSSHLNEYYRVPKLFGKHCAAPDVF